MKKLLKTHWTAEAAVRIALHVGWAEVIHLVCIRNILMVKKRLRRFIWNITQGICIDRLEEYLYDKGRSMEFAYGI